MVRHTFKLMKTIRTDGKFFSPEDTLECGQIFRYKSINGGFLVQSGDKCCFLKSVNDETEITFEDDDEEYFKKYFDLDFDYSGIVERAEKCEYEIVRTAAEKASGVRLLRQDLSETLFSFIISQNNMIPRIKAIIERTAASLGEKKSFMGEEYYSFPTAEVLAMKDADFYFKLGYGYRADYIPAVAKAIESGEFDFSDDGLTTAELRKKLISLKGVGPKVADCVALFGYHRTDSFPVDTWIEKLYREDFGGELKDRKRIAEFFTSRFGNDSGFIQQYIFYYKRSLADKD